MTDFHDASARAFARTSRRKLQQWQGQRKPRSLWRGADACSREFVSILTFIVNTHCVGDTVERRSTRPRRQQSHTNDGIHSPGVYMRCYACACEVAPRECLLCACYSFARSLAPACELPCGNTVACGTCVRVPVYVHACTCAPLALCVSDSSCSWWK